jgi:ArsR family metal-binding transcriptional regulator
MLLTMIEPEIVLPACDFERETLGVIGRFAEDISPVMPYLNGTQPKALYHAAVPVLRFRFEAHPVALRPHEIAIGDLEDSDEAIETLARVQRLINETWERREEITPTSVERKRLTAMQIYRLLPGTNCRQCHEPTCFVFANKVAAGQVEITACGPLCTDRAYADQRAQMMALLEAAI